MKNLRLICGNLPRAHASTHVHKFQVSGAMEFSFSSGVLGSCCDMSGISATAPSLFAICTVFVNSTAFGSEGVFWSLIIFSLI
jgi:hypothetical protein